MASSDGVHVGNRGSAYHHKPDEGKQAYSEESQYKNFGVEITVNGSYTVEDPASKESVNKSLAEKLGISTLVGLYNGYGTELKEGHGSITSRVKSRKRLWLIGLIILILALVIVIPVGVVLSREQRSGNESTDPEISRELDSTGRIASTQGAFNGTGLAAILPNHGVDHRWLFWQDYTGDVRLLCMNEIRECRSSLRAPVVTDAANGTALAALSYEYYRRSEDEHVPVQHLVYVDQHDYLADTILVDGEGPWFPGRLRDLNFLVPQPISLSRPSRLSFVQVTNTIGHLFASGPNEWLHEITCNLQDGTWTRRSRIHTNAFGGIAAATLNSNTVINVQTSPGELTTYSRSTPDPDSSREWDYWAGDRVIEASIYPNSSISHSVLWGERTIAYFYLDQRSQIVKRDLTRSSTGGRVEWMAENSTGVQVMPGSSLAAVNYRQSTPETPEAYVYYQSSGDDIQLSTVTQSGWTQNGPVVIP